MAFTPESLNYFPCIGVHRVTLTIDDVVAVNIHSNQPELHSVVITYVPQRRCVEPGSMSEFLASFGDRRVTVETIATECANQMMVDIEPSWVTVTVTQVTGIRTTVEAYRRKQ